MIILAIIALAGAGTTAVLGYYKVFEGQMASMDHSVTEVPVVYAPVKPEIAPQTPVYPDARVQPTVDKIRLCAAAQQAFEGWWPGSSSYTHNNPGNCKGLDGKFLTFPTYEAGFAYLEDYIRRAATGKHPAYPKGGATTIEAYTHIYTSDPEPSPTNYAAAIARGTGLSTASPLGALLS